MTCRIEPHIFLCRNCHATNVLIVEGEKDLEVNKITQLQCHNCRKTGVLTYLNKRIYIKTQHTVCPICKDNFLYMINSNCWHCDNCDLIINKSLIECIESSKNPT